MTNYLIARKKLRNPRISQIVKKYGGIRYILFHWMQYADLQRFRPRAFEGVPLSHLLDRTMTWSDTDLGHYFWSRFVCELRAKGY